ncbi:MAG: DUF2851 family protein [Ekhidna sp.]
MVMDEHFLHYLWKYQKFDHPQLTLTDGRSLIVFTPGFHNHDSGPDFEEARIKIDHLEWAGQIEIHINASDWNRHGHSSDPAYANVILHVVWNADREILVEGNPIPVLELKGLINPDLLTRYQLYMSAPSDILCADQFDSVSKITRSSALDKVLVERLEQKAEGLLTLLKKSQGDWESTTYQALASNFGFSTNKLAFQRLTALLPYPILKKNLHDLTKTEALVFGQAGFLEKPTDTYSQQLQKEHDFLKAKYELPAPLGQSEWKFGKMRPANFPTIRLAQFASLMHHSPQLFTNLISLENPKKIREVFDFELPDYWCQHYAFSKKRKQKQKHLGNQSLENLLINTVAPLLAAYGRHTDQQNLMDRAISLLEQVSPEKNRITKKWDEIGFEAGNAFDSQAQIQLFNAYCKPKKCLECSIGIEILGR